MPDENQAPPPAQRLPQGTKDLWLPLLDDPNNKQAIGVLSTSENPDTPSFCCLGLFAIKGCGASAYYTEVEDDEGDMVQADTLTIDHGNFPNINESELLDQVWADQYGITAVVQRLLSSLNDGGEQSIPNDDPLFHIWAKVGEDVSMRNGARRCQLDFTIFNLRKHTFAEIAKVIREDL